MIRFCGRRLSLTFVLVVLLVAAGCSVAFGAKAQGNQLPQPNVSSGAALLMEWQTGKIIFEDNGFSRMYPASLTKMMTALIALERGRLDDLVQVSALAASQPGSSMHLKTGDLFTLEDLMYGLMLNSGNDAAWAIAEHICSGDAYAFFDLMNERAKEIGAINTKFENPHGLSDPNHYTTAFDLALIAKTCLRHPHFRNLVSTKEKDAIEAEGRIVLSLYNTNRLLWLNPDVDGVKTGTTPAAGQCLVASAKKDGMQLITVVLDSSDRWHDASELLSFGFDNYRIDKLIPAGTVIVSLPVRFSTENHVPIVCDKDLYACVKKQSPKTEVVLDLPKSIKAPCPKGTIVGQATLVSNNQVVESSNLVTGDWVFLRTPWRLIVRLAFSVVIRFRSLGLI